MTTLWWCQQSRSHWKQWLVTHFGAADKLFFITAKELEPATYWVRDQDATSVPARHIWETGSLNCAQFIHASVTYQISWIRWIRWIPVPFRENSIVFNQTSIAALTRTLSVNEPLRLYFFWSPETIQKPENSTQSWRFQFTFDEIRYFTTCWSWGQEFYSEWWRSLRSWCHHQRRIDIVMVCKQLGYFT